MALCCQLFLHVQRKECILKWLKNFSRVYASWLQSIYPTAHWSSNSMVIHPIRYNANKSNLKRDEIDLSKYVLHEGYNNE